ncbi:MAG TPA: ATP-dependent zinc metalloprotease FtsH [Candidatus Latescibacteria bacterium]|nr:ATP-dependent zinc metalloprotease FtsH [Candidatus Latescibacterota bacterium]
MDSEKPDSSPRPAEPRKRRPSVSGRLKFSIWYAVLAVMIVLAIRQYSKPPSRTLSYTEFIQAVRERKVTAVAIGEDEIEGRIVGAGDSVRSFNVVRIRDDKGLVCLLDEYGISYRGVIPGPWPKILSWVLPMVVLIGFWVFILRRMGGPASGAMSIGKSKAKVYVETETKVTFADVAGIDEAAEEVREVVEFLKEPARFQKLGGRIPKGVLLVGPPGTGKTLLARAVAGESGVPFFSLSGSDFVEMFVGVGAARVRDLFQQAKGRSPCIVFIDELDALGKARGVNPLGGHDEREQTLNQLLTEMDGFDDNTGVIIMAATNRPETLDQALLRPGRFDRQIVVDRPDIKGREEILRVHARKVTLAPDVDLHQIAARTPGMVGADLANMINEAALLAARKNHPAVTMEDLNEAIDRGIGGLERKSRVLNETERRITAFHEAGHALVAEALPHTDPVHRVSIIPRGVTSLGQTTYQPTEDRYLMSKEELEDRLAVALAGRVAEEIVFGDVSTSAGTDFRRATRIAQHMVKDYGMSRLGLVSYGESTGFLAQPVGAGAAHYSEETAAEIDDEVRRIVSEGYQRVRELLQNNTDALHRLANALIERENLQGDEVREILRGSLKETETSAA